MIIPLPCLQPPDFFERLQHLSAPLLLESVSTEHPLGRHSYLAADPLITLQGSAEQWPQMREAIRRSLHHPLQTDPSLPPFQGGWAGYLGYELGAAFDRMPVRQEVDALPDYRMSFYDWVIAWDHQQERCWLISSGFDLEGKADPARALARGRPVLDLLTEAATGRGVLSGQAVTGADAGGGDRPATQVRADFTAAEYRAAIAEVIERIAAGEIFQANLTQRFTADFTGSPLQLYQTLRRLSPAPMAALMGADSHWIVSASPERFLRYRAAARQVETRPIKGTAALGEPEILLASEKDRAENLMIVDVLRNDLGRVCATGSIAVPVLCQLETHPTLHHLVSIVTGTLASGLDVCDLLAATFPGGSISGAPKIRALEILAELERCRRGIYCGAIGWIGLDGSMDTSIAIRTLLLRDGIATIQAGGGITLSSDPEQEYQESRLKAAALLRAVGAD